MTETVAPIVFSVGMTCEGCASACKRVLGKLEGVLEVETSVADKTVIVKSNGATSADTMLEALEKWGKASGKSVSKG